MGYAKDGESSRGEEPGEHGCQYPNMEISVSSTPTDKSYSKVFLITFKSFITADELFDFLRCAIQDSAPPNFLRASLVGNSAVDSMGIPITYGQIVDLAFYVSSSWRRGMPP
jgi:hypothetical protein